MTQDNKMPERLTLVELDTGFSYGIVYEQSPDGTPYIRADLVPAVTDDAKRKALHAWNKFVNSNLVQLIVVRGGVLANLIKHDDTIRAALQTPSDTALRESHDRLLEALIEANSVIEERVGESDGTREIRKLIKKTKKLQEGK